MAAGIEKARRGTRAIRMVVSLCLGLMALGPTGCERDPTGREASLTATEFIEIVVALRAAEQQVQRDAPTDSVEIEYERQKAAILERHGAAEADLIEFVESHHAHPARMTAIWDSITQRLRIPAEGLDEVPVLDN